MDESINKCHSYKAAELGEEKTRVRIGSSSSDPMASAALDKVRELLEEAAAQALPTEQVDALPSGFYDAFVLCGIRVHAVDPGRLLCHFTVPARLLNSGNFLHGGATASLVDLVGTAAFYTAGAQTRGSPLEMNISYLDAAFSDGD